MRLLRFLPNLRLTKHRFYVVNICFQLVYRGIGTRAQPFNIFSLTVSSPELTDCEREDSEMSPHIDE